MSLLSLENLSKSYGALKVTDGVSFAVASGKIVGILGSNGAGKTTLFNLVAEPVKPHAGRVLFKGQDISAIDASARCRMGISRSFQIPNPFNGVTVFENILVGATFGRPASIAPEARTAEVLRLTGLARRTNDRAGALTLQERKRREMARALPLILRFCCWMKSRAVWTERECQSLLGGIREVHSTGVMRLVNIAHGDLIVLAASVAMGVVKFTGLHPLLALIIVVPLLAVFGYRLQRLVLNRTLGHDLLPPPLP